MTEPDRSPPGDELTARYREASAQDTRRPGAHVRDAVRAHAEMVIAAGKAQGAHATATAAPTQRPAANQSRWKISALASVALVGLTGLLVLQFDRGTDEEKDLTFGQPSASAPPVAATAPVPAPALPPAVTPAPAPINAPAAIAPQAPITEARARAEPAESAPPPALKAPETPAAKKAAPQPALREQAAAKAEAETAQAFGSAAAPSVASPPAAVSAPPPAPTAVARDSARIQGSARTADAAAGMQADAPASRAAPAAAPAPAPALVAPSYPAAMPAPRPAAAPAAAPAPAPAMAAAAPPAPVAAAPAAAAVQQQEKSAAPARSLRADAAGSLNLADALQQAARTGNLQQLDRLLQQGAPLNAADAAGRTPLILAVMQGHTATVQRLLAAGANTALIDKDGLNALQHARRLGLDGIAHLIERGS